MALKKSSFSRNTFQQCKTICNRIKNISNIINWFIVNANLSKASYEEEEMKMANKGTSFNIVASFIQRVCGISRWTDCTVGQIHKNMVAY